jgi:glucose/arabinose dehydrogenase
MSRRRGAVTAALDRPGAWSYGAGVRRVQLITLTAIGLVTLLTAAPADAKLGLKKVGHFDDPTYLTSPPGDAKHLFVTERAGVVRVLTDGRKGSRSFLNIKSRVTTRSEGGLLSIAFAPNYSKSRRFYVFYVDKQQNINVDEFRARRHSATKASGGSRRRVIRIKSPPDTHKGGQLQMTKGGYLLIGTGDGGDFESPGKKAQDRHSLLGKLLRIRPATERPNSQPQYRPHPDNPYAHSKRGSSAILALGFRNPFRFSLDRKRPDRIVIGEVGHSHTEEVDGGSLAKLAGANFGWPCYEGTRRLEDCKVKHQRKPLFSYSHHKGRCAIAGGYINRAEALPRQGQYLYGDYCSGEIRTADLRRGRSQSTGLRVPTIVSFGEDARGNLYTVSLAGDVKRIVNR